MQSKVEAKERNNDMVNHPNRFSNQYTEWLDWVRQQERISTFGTPMQPKIMYNMRICHIFDNNVASRMYKLKEYP